jgi:hypothetical protein
MIRFDAQGVRGSNLGPGASWVVVFIGLAHGFGFAGAGDGAGVAGYFPGGAGEFCVETCSALDVVQVVVVEMGDGVFVEI